MRLIFSDDLCKILCALDATNASSEQNPDRRLGFATALRAVALAVGEQLPAIPAVTVERPTPRLLPWADSLKQGRS